MGNKKKYVIDMDLFKEEYKKKTGKLISVYEIADKLDTTYQTVNTFDNKPIRALTHLKKLSSLSGIPINKLVKNVQNRDN